MARKFFLPLIMLVTVAALTGCHTKNTPRYEHEGKREWTPAKAPVDATVDDISFQNVDLKTFYPLLNDPKADLVKQVLQPLAKFVLNGKFIEVPRYHTTKMGEMFDIFSKAFQLRLQAKDTSQEFKAIKDQYEDAMLSGCSRDLRTGCVNADMFAADPFTSNIIMLLVNDKNGQIEKLLDSRQRSAQMCINPSDDCLKPENLKPESPMAQKCKEELAVTQDCRDQIEWRYRMLSFGIRRRNYIKDTDFSFAYMKYARLMGEFLAYVKKHAATDGSPDNPASDLTYSYLTELHGPIFETLISHYQPSQKDIESSTELKSFVENFNPWTYSRLHSDVFQHGTEVMFELGAKCCLYTDQKKTQIAKAVSDAILESQKAPVRKNDGSDDDKPRTFQEMVKELKDHANENTKNRFHNPEAADITAGLPVDTDTGFYDEYFLALDRLYNDDLNSNEVAMILSNANAASTVHKLPIRIQQYIRVVVAWMTLQTAKDMAKVMTDDIPADALFETTQARSRNFTDRWNKVQQKIDLFDKLESSYFVAHPPPDNADYHETDRLLKAVNRNVNYLTVYTNMIAMSYYIAKLNGTRTVTSFWGGKFDIAPDKTVKNFFAGQEPPWFIFAKDVENPNRLTILYAFEYLLSFDMLNEFTKKDALLTRGSIMNLIFSKLVGSDIDVQESAFEAFVNRTEGNKDFSQLKDICDYELGDSNNNHVQPLDLIKIQEYTYTGIGANGLNLILSTFLTDLKPIATALNSDLEARSTMLKNLIDVLSAGVDPKSEDLKTAKALLAHISSLRARVQNQFVKNQRMLKCALQLREVERHRAYRLIDEERAYLTHIYKDVMLPIYQVKQAGGDVQTAIECANLKEFGYKTEKTCDVKPEDVPKTSPKFDRVNPDLTYTMSKFDFLMRVKSRIENDVFVTPGENELAQFGGPSDKFHKPRPVTVDVPQFVLTHDDMIQKALKNSILFTGDKDTDRDAFVAQGLKYLNGTKDIAYVTWLNSLSNDSVLSDYLEAAENAFIMMPPDRDKDGNPFKDANGNVQCTDPSAKGLSGEDLATDFTKIIGSYSMDKWDEFYAPTFELPGRAPKKFFQDMIFDTDGVNRLPFYFKVMQDTLKLAQLNVDQEDGAAHDALEFKQNFASVNSGENTFLFAPSKAVENSVKFNYGCRINYRFDQVTALFTAIQKLNEPSKLPEEVKRPFYRENNDVFPWYHDPNNPKYRGDVNEIVDTARERDLKNLYSSFYDKTTEWIQVIDPVSKKPISKQVNFYGASKPAGL